MNEYDVYVLKQGVTWKGRDFGSVLWIPRAHRKVYLNPSATAAVRQLDGHTPLNEIIATQAATFHLPAEQAARDTLRLFERLSTANLITTDLAHGKPVSPDTVSPHLDYITLALTNRCNLRCKHCFVSAGEAVSGELTIGDWLHFVEQLPPFRLFDVILTGGEVLLYHDLWRLIDALNAHEIAVSLFTNGVLVNDAFIERAQHALLNSVQISLDGVSAEAHERLRGAHGIHAKTVRAIERLSRAGIPVHVAVTVTQLNYAEHHHFIDFCKQLGARSVNFSEIVLNGRARDNADELLLNAEQIAQMRLYHSCRRVTDHGIQIGEGLRPPDYAYDPFHPARQGGAQRRMCSAAKDSCDITATGNVLACQAIWWDELKAGNILYMPLKEIWETAANMQLFRKMDVDQFRECNACEFKYDCGGGCRSLAYAAYHDLYAPSDEISCAWKKIFFKRFYEEVRPQPTLDALLAYQHSLEPMA